VPGVFAFGEPELGFPEKRYREAVAAATRCGELFDSAAHHLRRR